MQLPSSTHRAVVSQPVLTDASSPSAELGAPVPAGSPTPNFFGQTALEIFEGMHRAGCVLSTCCPALQLCSKAARRSPRGSPSPKRDPSLLETKRAPACCRQGSEPRVRRLLATKQHGTGRADFHHIYRQKRF